MPLPFEICIKNGGKVRTKKLKGGKYIHLCWINGTSYSGEVKKKKNENKTIFKKR